MYSLKIVQDTFLKQSSAQSSALPDSQKQFIKAGATLPLTAWLTVADHIKITLGKDISGNQVFFAGRNTWFVYAPCAQLFRDGQPVSSAPVGGLRQTNAAGLALIKQFEGCVLTAYPDPGTGGDPWTIGYGHTGSDVYRGLSITQQQAEDLLKRDLQRFEQEVCNLVKVSLTDNQFAALVSFDYNTGSLSSSTLLRLLNASNYQGAADQFLQWTHAGNQVLPGLVSRRQAERRLFLS